MGDKDKNGLAWFEIDQFGSEIELVESPSHIYSYRYLRANAFIFKNWWYKSFEMHLFGIPEIFLWHTQNLKLPSVLSWAKRQNIPSINILFCGIRAKECINGATAYCLCLRYAQAKSDIWYFKCHIKDHLNCTI